MAKKRLINTKFWDDTFIRTLSPDGKLLFLYLLTNPLTELCGVYEISLERISLDTNIQVKTIETLLNSFKELRKVLYTKGYIFVKNFPKHQYDNPNIQKGILRSLQEIPAEIRKNIEEFNNSSRRVHEESGKPKLKLKPKLYERVVVTSTTFCFSEKLKAMEISKDKRMHIIHLYWLYKKFEFKNQEQYSAALKRELRPSQLLIGYDIMRIKDVMFYLNGEEWIDWTLETVHKYIDKDLTKLIK